ncbi:MAG: DoxX protein [Flavobacterium sp. BFFFF1]|uniref:DoxX protein n=1 Tax=unclassified Flavobacterium TaxID=196869 RepID=UPI000BCA44CB|nr:MULTISPECIES: DoxX protein [unclassified Flavobacterium]OYU79877.1 MAG: DoxX protein [Flavobacterium sp. BFFFF1]
MNSKFTKIVRILLGLILLASGLNKMLPSPFIPIPSLGEASYVLKFVGILEILIGLLLIVRKWVPFALIVLAPISVNILLFHLFLDLSGIAGAIVVGVLNGILIYKHWKAYKPLFH